MTLLETLSEVRRLWWASPAGQIKKADMRAKSQANAAAVKAKARASALQCWNARGKFVRRRKSLENAFRSAVRKGTQSKRQNLLDLKRATRSVVLGFHSRVNAKLTRRLRRYFEKSFAAGSKSARVKELLGCTVDQLRAHLEAQFKPGMTWANHSFIGWHLDHIRPLASFNLADPEQQKRAFHFSNLQPLWAKDNFDKSDVWM
jgi:hypothetical protein